jgi:16S rRNA (guanine966-N2)-methyltransferase
LRIVAGRHRGRAIAAPEGLQVRPTADRARQAVFDVLAHGADIAGVLTAARVLDTFAGTGAMGLEALSRGAERVWFMERDPAAVAAIRANAARLGESKSCTVLRADALHPPAAELKVSLAFLDPPYGENLAAEALEALAAKGWFADGAIVVVEHDAEDEVVPPHDFHPVDARRYGRARFLFLRYQASGGN